MKRQQDIERELRDEFHRAQDRRIYEMVRIAWQYENLRERGRKMAQQCGLEGM